jgi:ribosomal protein S18 acetylase RimI-like enzyme
LPIVEDRWLAERFGHPVWTVRGASSAEVHEHVAAHPGRALYQAKVPTADVATVLDLARARLVAVNVNCVLERAPARSDVPDATGVTVRVLDPARDAAVLDIAAGAFSLSRFHLDPRIPDAVADSIKRDWVDSYLHGRRGEFAYVAEHDGVLAGFLAVAAAGEARVIDLVGVAASARDRGVGAALVRRFLGDAEGRVDRVEVGTQAANASATRFYERAGFRAARAAYDLHRLED